jgi:hypothetical protein
LKPQATPGVQSDANITAITPGVVSNNPILPYATPGSSQPLSGIITGAKLPAGSKVSLVCNACQSHTEIPVVVTRYSDTEIHVQLSGFGNQPPGDYDLVLKDSFGNQLTQAAGLFYVSNLSLDSLEVNQAVPMTCSIDVGGVLAHVVAADDRAERAGSYSYGECEDSGQGDTSQRRGVECRAE